MRFKSFSGEPFDRGDQETQEFGAFLGSRLFYKGDAAVSQTNTNQAQVAQDQQATQAQILAQQQRETLPAIERDLGNPTNPVLAPPSGLPSVDAVLGPTEDAAISSASIANAGTWASEAQNAIDPNPTGILQTFENSANAGMAIEGATAAAGASSLSGATASYASGAQGTNLPLGPQYTYADSDPSSSGTTTSSGGGSVIIFIALALVAIGIFVYVRHEHKRV